MKSDESSAERRSLSILPYVLLLLFVAITSTLPNLIKANQVNKAYKFSIASVLFTANLFISSIAFLLNGKFENPLQVFRTIGWKTTLKLVLIRLVHNIDLCLDPIVLTMVSVADRNVFGPPFGLFFVAALRFLVFRAALTQKQVSILLLIFLLIFASEGEKFQKGSFDKAWVIGVMLIFTCRCLQSMGRVSTEKVLKEELQQLEIWQKVFAGSVVDIFLYIPLMFVFNAITGSSAIFYEGWTWKTILLCSVYIFQTMLIYHILNLLDTMYLMLGGFSAGLFGVVLSYFWINEPFVLAKFIIIIVLFAMVIGYELEGISNKILCELKADLDSERKYRLYWDLVKRKDRPLYLPSTRKMLHEIFDDVEEKPGRTGKERRRSRYSLDLDAGASPSNWKSVYIPGWAGNYTFV